MQLPVKQTRPAGQLHRLEFVIRIGFPVVLRTDIGTEVRDRKWWTQNSTPEIEGSRDGAVVEHLSPMQANVARVRFPNSASNVG